MLAVLCSDSELAEYGEVLSIGDRLERPAGIGSGDYYGSELDRIRWTFDRFAQLTGRADGIATITGLIVAIDAVYAQLTRRSRGWGPAPGTAIRESLYSTADTRRVEPRIVWGRASGPDENGCATRAGYPVFEEGDEYFSGWVITLDDEMVVRADG